MKDLEFLEDLIKILIPAAAVMYAMYLVVKSFLNKEFERKLVEMKIRNTDVILPIRLQAYERMSLFLERISPAALILRVNQGNYTAAQLQQILVSEIREEFNHNLSQQIYMSDQAWKNIRSAMDNVISLINNSFKTLAPEAKGMELAKKIFDELMQKNEDPVQPALLYLKTEIQKVF
jgi:hypothetical protein